VILDEAALADAEAYASDAEAVAGGILPAASGAGASYRTAPAPAVSHGSVDANGTPGLRTAPRHRWHGLMANAEAVSGARTDAPMQDIALRHSPAPGTAPHPATSVHGTLAVRGATSEVG
jgi:hypothetical protein